MHQNNHKKAIDMNNQGAYLVANGEYESAIHILNQVLALVQNDLTSTSSSSSTSSLEREQEHQEPTSTSSTSSIDGDDDVVMEQQPHHHQEVEVDTIDCVSTTKESSLLDDRYMAAVDDDAAWEEDCYYYEDYDDEKEDFIYREPIFIETNKDDDDDGCGVVDLEDYSTTISVTCVFNLALAHHLTAIDQQDSTDDDDTNEQQRLRVALRLYEVCYLMQRNSLDQAAKNSNTSSSSSCIEKMSLSHTLGLVNNSGQIHKSLHQYKRANRLFQHLLSSLVLVSEMDETDTGIGPDGGDDNNIDQLEGLWKTASQLVLTNPEVASAA